MPSCRASASGVAHSREAFWDAALLPTQKTAASPGEVACLCRVAESSRTASALRFLAFPIPLQADRSQFADYPQERFHRAAASAPPSIIQSLVHRPLSAERYL